MLACASGRSCCGHLRSAHGLYCCEDDFSDCDDDDDDTPRVETTKCVGFGIRVQERSVVPYASGS